MINGRQNQRNRKTILIESEKLSFSLFFIHLGSKLKKTK